MADEASGQEHRASTAASAPFVVVVDDEPPVLATFERLLKAWGFRTAAFGTFEEARTALSADPPDVVVTDVRLGSHNGLHLLHIARQRSPHTILVAVSGIDDAVLRAEAASAGAAYFLKPTGLTELRDYLLAETGFSPGAQHTKSSNPSQ